MGKILRLYKMLVNKNYSTLAGSIAFFIVINGGSILFLVIKLLGYFNVNLYVNNSIINNALDHFNDYTSDFSYLYSIFFLFTSLWSSSTLFYHLIKCSEMIYGIKKKYNTLYRIVAIFFVLLFLALLLSGAIISFIIKQTIGNYNILYRLFQVIVVVISPILIILFFNMFFCPVQLKFKDAIKGSLFTFIFWIFITIVFALYIKLFANYKRLYGALATFIIFMIWIYLISIGLVIGFIINEKNFLKLHNLNLK